MSRRGFVAAAGAAGVGLATAGWFPTTLLTPAAATAGDAVPLGFPAALGLYKWRYENWSGETAVDDVWTCVPRRSSDIVAVANWAWTAGYQVRPRGYMHNWAPYTITNDQAGDGRVVLVDTTRHLVGMQMAAGWPAAVRVQTGATMESLLEFLEAHGRGLVSVPAIGEISVGGALAIGGHGAATPAAGEAAPPGGAFGSVSNLVLRLKAVTWNPLQRRYELRRFTRADPETSALLTHLGRAFITEVTIQVAPLQNLRCESFTDIPSATVFAPPAHAGPESFAGFLDRAGRVEAIIYPFTDKPWLKVWTVSPTKPRASRRTWRPYNYAFSDRLPKLGAELAGRIIKGDVAATPLFGQVEYTVTDVGLTALNARDLWGTAKNTQHYIKATTLRVTANGGLVVVPRREVQRAVSEYYDKYRSMMASYRARGLFPINGPVEIRTSSVDRARDVLAAGAEAPALSALHEHPDRPEWDTAIWMNILTFPGTPYADQFYMEMEAWARRNFASYGSPRQEWTKGWAYTRAGAWTDAAALSRTIPAGFEHWDWALRTFNTLDPHRIFSNPFLDRLLP
jgi:FAD/FMN-containing dehydrogenase